MSEISCFFAVFVLTKFLLVAFKINLCRQYEIQPEGPVQEISYVKDGDSAVLRFVKEEDLNRLLLIFAC